MATSEFVCGTGEWVGPKPGDPDNNIVLNATGTFGGIDVSWSYPATNPYAVAHTVLYRGLTDNFAGAVKHTIVAGNYFFDKFGGDEPVVYYYWVQMVSVNGTYASIVGPATATARPTIEDTIRQLSGKIDQGALAQELRSNIDHIGLLDNTISGEIRDRIAANQALGVALNGVQSDVDSAITLIETEVSERINANSALLTSLNLMGVGFQNSVAGLTEEVELVATANTALASKINTVEATVNGDTATGQVGLTAKVNAVTGAVESMYTAKVGANGLIGGFGLYNDGTVVEAGFDVDRFWVGRTGDNKTKPFIIENDEVFIDTAVIKTLTADKIDSRGLTIRDLDGKVILSAGNPLDFSTGIANTPDKPQPGATRNVYKGKWTVNTNYEIGDVVLDAAGYAWTALKVHYAIAATQPPKYPETENTYWGIYALKGEDALNGTLSNSTASVSASHDGIVSPASLASNGTGVFSLYKGVDLIPDNEIVFSVVEAIGCTGSIDATGTYSVTRMVSDPATLVMRASYQGSSVDKVFSMSMSKQGFSPINYWIVKSASTVKRNNSGQYEQPTVTFVAKQGSKDFAAKDYSGRFIISHTSDGINYINDYVSLFNDEATVNYVIPSGALAIKAKLYEAGGTTVLLDEESITIVEDGITYDVKIESTNGTIFRIGQSKQTTLKARVFKNGIDVTSSLPDSVFKWERVSLEPREAPNDDATWNSKYQAGYKQITVSVDDVHAKATFHCQINQ